MSLEFPWYLSQIMPSGSRGNLRCMIFIRYPHMWIERSESSIRTRKSHTEIQAWQSLRKQAGGYEVSTACGNAHKSKAFVACLIHLQNGASCSEMSLTWCKLVLCTWVRLWRSFKGISCVQVFPLRGILESPLSLQLYWFLQVFLVLGSEK